MTYLQKAFELAERGFDPLPIVDKRCFIKGWPDVDCQDEELQAEWSNKWPDADVAARCTNLTVVDVDVKPGQGGLRTLHQWMCEYGGMPETTTVRTRSGGIHYYFQRFEVDRKKFDGIDIKTGNAYVGAPPSSGYRWESTAPICPAPVWLRRLCRPQRRPITVPQVGQEGDWSLQIERMRNTGPGGRDDKFWQYLWTMHNKGAARSDIEQLAQAALDAGLTRGEIDKKLRRIQISA